MGLSQVVRSEKDGKISFGRASTLFTLVFGFAMVVSVYTHDIQNPSVPIDVKIYKEEIQQVVTITQFVSRPNLSDYAAFLLSIAGLGGMLYGGGKLAGKYTNGHKQ